MSRLLYYGLPAEKSGSLIYKEGGMEEIRLMKGNEVVAEAAVRCGCDGYFGYPITPQSEILETLTAMRPWETTGMVVLQAESEVAAVNMLYGGAACGRRVMASSSSPGNQPDVRGAQLPGRRRTAVRGGERIARRAGARDDPAVAGRLFSGSQGRRPRRLPPDRAGSQFGAGDVRFRTAGF